MEHYYDDARAACTPCGRKREEAVVAIAAILVCAGLLLSCSVASTRIEVVASFVRVRPGLLDGLVEVSVRLVAEPR